ncbi:hypothetical protein Emed_003264 [Eimeria media]
MEIANPSRAAEARDSRGDSSSSSSNSSSSNMLNSSNNSSSSSSSSNPRSSSNSSSSSSSSNGGGRQQPQDIRFGDTASNVGILSFLDSTEQTKNLPVGIKTALASCGAAGWRLFLMPIDAWKTTKQVEGGDGLKQLAAKGTPTKTITITTTSTAATTEAAAATITAAAMRAAAITAAGAATVPAAAAAATAAKAAATVAGEVAVIRLDRVTPPAPAFAAAAEK